MSSFRISLNNLEFYARIGVGEQERQVGNMFRVDVVFDIDASGFVDEDIESTVSYADVYDIIKEEMKIPRMLLESTAKRIAENLKTAWPKILHSSVRIIKCSVPVSGITGNCSVEYIS